MKSSEERERDINFFMEILQEYEKYPPEEILKKAEEMADEELPPGLIDHLVQRVGVSVRVLQVINKAHLN